MPRRAAPPTPTRPQTTRTDRSASPTLGEALSGLPVELVDELPIGLLVQGPRAEIQFANPAALHLLGLTEAQLLGLTSQDPSWNVIHEDGTPFPGETHPVPRALASGSPVRGVVMGVYRPRLEDRVWLLVDAIPRRAPDGAVRHVICTFSDITTRRAAEEALRRQGAFLGALHETTVGLIERLDTDELLSAIVSRAAHLMDTSDGYLYLVEPDGGALRVAIGIGTFVDHVGLRLRAGEGLAGRVWTTGSPTRVDDYDRYTGRSNQIRPGTFHAVMGAPLTSEGRVVGVLGLAHRAAERQFDQADLDQLSRFAQLASVALDNARLYTALGERVAELADSEEALRASEQRYRLLFERNPQPMWVVEPSSLRINAANEAASRVYGFAASEFLERTLLDLRPSSERRDPREEIRKVVEAHPERPSTVRHLRADGTPLDVELTTERVELDGKAQQLVLAVDVTERLALARQIERHALYDELTELANRALFVERLTHALARRRARDSVAVLFIDADNFKVVNDSLGHAAGDELLVQLGARLRSIARPGDTVARLGGDEFAILLEDVRSAADTVRVVERVLNAARAPFDLDGHELFVTASVGVAFGTPGSISQAELMRQADVALYRAKSGGRDHFVVFDDEMNSRALERLDIESDLRHALERGELLLHYQPEVDLLSGRIVGVEALARWQHPRRGLLSPAAFIGVAEETGLILPLGQWVLEAACRQARVWQQASCGSEPFLMSVNLSVRQFQQHDLAERVEGALRAAGLAAEQLRLEITESMLLDLSGLAPGALENLRGLGVSLALDDFGTGYSSLGLLRSLPVSTLKVDRAFVTGLPDSGPNLAIVQAVVRLAHALGLRVVAEGIETPAEAAALRDAGCDRGQGYHFARPLPAEQVTDLLREQAAGLVPPRVA